MAKQFLHVGFDWGNAPKLKQLEEIFNRASDWLRYAPNCWILWTGRSPNQWARRIRPLLDPGDHFFICKLDIDERQGWLPRWVWDWLRQDRQS